MSNISSVRGEPSDLALIKAALDLARTHKNKRIREVLPGVTEHDISRWRKGEDYRLGTDKRKALLLAWRDGGLEVPERDEMMEGRISAAAIAVARAAHAGEPIGRAVLSCDVLTRLLKLGRMSPKEAASAALEIARTDAYSAAEWAYVDEWVHMTLSTNEQ